MMMALIKRWMWPGLISLAILAGLIYAFLPSAQDVEVATVTRGPMKVTVEDDGITRIHDVYTVSAPVNGLVERIEMEAGDTVAANETVVARMRAVDPGFLDLRTANERRAALDAAQAAQAQAQAVVTQQQAQLNLAKIELKRIQALFDKGYATAAQLDQARTTESTLQSSLAMAEAALKQRSFDVKTAQASLIEPGHEDMSDHSQVDVRSPVSGRVLKIMEKSEQVVAAGTPLMELGNPRDLEIVIDFLSRDAVKITPGDAAEIERWGGPGILNGKVERVEPFGFLKVSSLGIEEQRVNVIIQITDPYEKWSKLGHGYQVDAAVVLWKDDNALRIPISALFRQGTDWATFVDDDGRARLQTVKVGQMNADYAQVLDGIKPGEQVIINPSNQITDGSRVNASIP